MWEGEALQDLQNASQQEFKCAMDWHHGAIVTVQQPSMHALARKTAKDASFLFLFFIAPQIFTIHVSQFVGTDLLDPL